MIKSVSFRFPSSLFHSSLPVFSIIRHLIATRKENSLSISRRIKILEDNLKFRQRNDGKIVTRLRQNDDSEIHCAPCTVARL